MEEIFFYYYFIEKIRVKCKKKMFIRGGFVTEKT